MTDSLGNTPGLRILMVSDACVDPQRSSSQAHVAQVIEGLLREGHQVDCAYMSNVRGFSSPFLDRLSVQAAGLRLLGNRAPSNLAGIDVLWLTNLWTVGTLQVAVQLLERVRRDAHPAPITVFDSMDWLAKGVGARLPDPERSQFARLENCIRQQVDYNVVISEKERADVVHAFGLPPERVSVLGQIFVCDAKAFGRSHAERRNLCLVGALHEANLEGLQHFLRHIFPLVLAAEPALQLQILGTMGEGMVLHLPGPMRERVQVCGFVPEIEGAVADCRVQVVPLLAGAGIKGKLLQSLACGTAVVSTPCGVEGIPAESGRELLIAETPRLFADAVLALYRDAGLWERLRIAGGRLVNERYSGEVFRQQLRSLLERMAAQQRATPTT